MIYTDPSAETNAIRKKLTPDDLLTQCGSGAYQTKTLIAIGFVVLNEGAEVLILSFLLAILGKEWNLTSNEKSHLGSAIWIGSFLGVLIAGKIVDTFGRKPPMVYAVVLMYVSALGSAFVNSFNALLILRVVYGFMQGFEYTICLTYLSEIIPKEVRGKYMILIGLFWILGELFVCGIGFLLLDSIDSGNWRGLLIWAAQPALLGFIGLYSFVEESPRFLIAVKKDINGGVEIFKKIALQNKVLLNLDQKQLESLEEWVNNNSLISKQESLSNLSTLFNKHNLRNTIFLWPIWFALALVYYGIMIALPLIVSNQTEDQNGLLSMLVPVIGELPATIGGYLLIENKLFGRKNTIMLTLFISAILCFIAWFFSFWFVIWISIARALISVAMLIVYPFTLELYPTPIRGSALSMASGFARFGGVATPWMVIKLIEWAPKTPFVAFGIACGVGAFSAWCLRYDTTKIELDVEMKEY